MGFFTDLLPAIISNPGPDSLEIEVEAYA